MLLVANLDNTKRLQKTWKMTETLANGYSYESTQRELSNEYQHDRASMVFEKYLSPCPLDESSLSIRGVNTKQGQAFLFFMNLVSISLENVNQNQTNTFLFVLYAVSVVLPTVDMF